MQEAIREYLAAIDDLLQETPEAEVREVCKQANAAWHQSGASRPLYKILRISYSFFTALL